jgi:tetratricopeptide (TPR) repeat protein
MKRFVFSLSVLACWAVVRPQTSLQPSSDADVSKWEQAMVRADGHFHRADYGAALDELRSALLIAERFSPEDRRLALTLNRMGAVYCETGQYRKAENSFVRALAALDRAQPDTVDRAVILEGLESVYTQTGEFGKAERYGRQALEVREKNLGIDDPDLGPPLQNLAAVLHSERRYAEAESLYLRALRVLRNGGRSTDRAAASVHNNLARLFCDTGKLERGIEEAKIAVSMWENALGPDHPEVARGLGNLGSLYCRGRRWADAEEPLQRARRITATALGNSDPRLDPILRTYADVLMHTGRKQEAKQMLRDADAIRKQFNRDNLVGYTVDVKAYGQR